MTRRRVLKALHWVSFGLILWFWLVEPEDVERLGAAALATHAGMDVVLAIVVGVWLITYLRRGMASRPGPKLPIWARRIHPWMHRALMWGLPATIATGAATGLAAPYVIRAFGVLPINPGVGSRDIHNMLEELHEIAFDLLIIGILLHAGFHIWRHYGLRDSALRIMAPRLLHRWL